MDTDGIDTQLDDFIQSAFDTGAEYAACARGSERPKVESIGTAKRRRGPRTLEAGADAQKKPGGAAALANPAAALASPAERQNARELLSEIGKRFAENRKKSKSKAFESYQQDLANNSGTLVMGGAVTLKELTVLLMDLEGYMKSTEKQGETAATRLQKFLAGQLSDEVE